MLVGQQLGPFAIEKELGSGAMGAVYRARYTKTGQLVAIKVMAPGLGTNERSLARFEREAAILKQFKHPNIVRLFGHGKFHGTPYYAMEYIEGESLDRVMQRRDRYTWEEVVTLGQQLCAALQHAHEQGVIHRDLKPSNLMMLPDGTLKLTDFGIAKDLDVTQLTSAHCTVGTAAYMSPEQCRGERNLTHKSDLYSMGVLFYELLTGRKPFVAENPMDMFLLHVQGEFERPSRLVLEIPVWLDTLVCQLLEKKPEQRPFDAATVAQALGRIVEKVSAQQSAGVDAVKTRMVDRSATATLPDAEDRDSARTILTGMHKGRRKRRAKPFYQQAWFQALSIAALLLAVAVVLYLVSRPASPERLYQDAQKLMTSSNHDDHVRAREGPIKEFLSRYTDRQDEQAVQIRDWADEVDINVLDRQLQNRSWLSITPESEAEGLAFAAVRRESAAALVAARRDPVAARADLTAARDQWLKLEKYKEDKNPELRIYALLAARKTKELTEKLSRTRETHDTDTGPQP